ncbi:MAG: hypothetical protein K2G47_12105 [Muribaculum sp.]|nr:hypothetical protein [Muribaculum sp.]
MKYSELESVYHSDMKSFFEYFDFLNMSKVAQRAGINRKYTSGVANAGESQTFCRALMGHVFFAPTNINTHMYAMQHMPRVTLVCVYVVI